MDFATLIDFVVHLDQYLYGFTQAYGLWVHALLALIIFCETGLVVLPFLPGDSLLFVAGAVAAVHGLNPFGLALCLFVAAGLGDSTNYWIGWRYGLRLFARSQGRWVRRDHLEHTELFYARHGAKTVVIARFFPILRTFSPFAAGLARMPYQRFLCFSLLGSVLWVGGLVGLGYWFGNVPFIRDHLMLLILAVIGLSVLPLLIGYWRSTRRAL